MGTCAYDFFAPFDDFFFALRHASSLHGPWRSHDWYQTSFLGGAMGFVSARFSLPLQNRRFVASEEFMTAIREELGVPALTAVPYRWPAQRGHVGKS